MGGYYLFVQMVWDLLLMPILRYGDSKYLPLRISFG